MRLKFEISPKMVYKFEEILAKQLGVNIHGTDINDLGSQYQFEFRVDGGNWYFELDKECNANAWYALHCSTQELHLPIHYIKDIRIFCQQIARIKQMQTDYVNSK
jgi:hypothetical protein